MELKNNQVEELKGAMVDFLGPQEKFIFIGKGDKATYEAIAQKQHTYIMISIAVFVGYVFLVLGGNKLEKAIMGIITGVPLVLLFVYFYYQKAKTYTALANHAVYGLTNMRIFYTDIHLAANKNVFKRNRDNEAPFNSFYFKDIHEVKSTQDKKIDIDLNDYTSSGDRNARRRIIHHIDGVENAADLVAAVQELLVPFRLPKN